MSQLTVTSFLSWSSPTVDWVLKRGRSSTFVNGSKGPVKSYKSAKYEFEKGYLVHLLKLCGGKASEAAKLAGKSRTDFYELLRKHEIRIDDFRRNELMQG